MQEITQDQVKKVLQESQYVIFDFSSPGCAPCKKVKPLLDEVIMESELGDNLKTYEIDITKEPAIAQDYMVLGVPTLIVFKNGKEVSRFHSLPKKKKILQVLN